LILRNPIDIFSVRHLQTNHTEPMAILNLANNGNAGDSALCVGLQHSNGRSRVYIVG